MMAATPTLTPGVCPRCGQAYDDHRLPPVGSAILPMCPPKKV